MSKVAPTKIVRDFKALAEQHRLSIVGISPGGSHIKLKLRNEAGQERSFVLSFGNKPWKPGTALNIKSQVRRFAREAET